MRYAIANEPYSNMLERLKSNNAQVITKILIKSGIPG